MEYVAYLNGHINQVSYGVFVELACDGKKIEEHYFKSNIDSFIEFQITKIFFI